MEYMKLMKVTTAFLSMSIASAIQAASFDITGQISAKNSGQIITDAKITLREASSSKVISGRIIDADTGSGVAGAQVFVDVKPEIGGISPAIAITDSEGNYELVGLGAEIYTIGVWKSGFATQYRMNLNLISNQSLTQDLLVKPVEVSEDYVVLLRAEFENVKFHPDHDEAWADQMFFDDTPGAASVRNFYYQLSHGHLDLKKGANALVQVTDSTLQYPHENSDRDDIVDYVVHKSKSKVNYNDPKLDRSASWDHDPGADDKIDHVVVMTAGLPKSITGSSCDMNPVSMLNSEYVTSNIKTPVQALVPEYSPLGNIIHEMFHSMGETAVQDLYIGGTCDSGDELSTPLGTVGKWGTMGIGMYNKLNQYLPDPRGESCEAAYVDPCEGQDGMCTARMFGEQPSLPVPWTMWKWYHKYFWNNGVLENVSIKPGQSQTVRLYPYSTSNNGAQVITVSHSTAGQWWTITNRQPIGFDKGLIHSDTMEGQVGIVIDFNDTSLAGRMNLRGPTRIRDSHPGTIPDYTHYSCRARIDDAAFNIGEVEQYHEDELSVQLLEEHDDGSISVLVSSGSSAPSMASKLKANSIVVIDNAQEYEGETHDQDEVMLEVTPAKSQSLNNKKTKAKHTETLYKGYLESTQLSTVSKMSVNTVTTSDSNGLYSFNGITEGDWSLKVDACGYAQSNRTIKVNGNEVSDFELTDDASRTIFSAIDAPVTGQIFSKDSMIELDASSTSTFGNSTYEWRSNLDGLLANSAQESVSLSEGQHEISLTVTNELCSHTQSVSIEVVAGQVNQLPDADFSFASTGLSVEFLDSSTDSDGSITSWNWDFGDSQSSTEQNPSHTYQAEGDYTVTLTVIDEQGAESSTSKNVSVSNVSVDPWELINGVAKTNIGIAAKDENHYNIHVPAGTTIMEIKFSGTGDADLYVKSGQQATRNYGGYDYKAAGYGSNESITVENPPAGEWHVMVYAYSKVSSGNLQVNLTTIGENQSPNANFNFATNNLNVSFSDQSSDPDGSISNWSWSFGDGSSSSEQNPSHVFSQDGSYQVTLTVSDDQGAQDSFSQTVTVSESGSGSEPYELQSGVAKSPIIVGSKAEEMYHIIVPQNTSSMTITLTGDGDGDLYVKLSEEPTRNYGGADYKATKWGSDELITISNPGAGVWYIMVYGYKEMTEGSLKVDIN